jgi:hypothetical protein
VRAPVNDVAKVWVPLEGPPVAKLPYVKDNRQWLRHTVRVRSPQYAKLKWTLPRNCLARLVHAAIDRYGQVDLYRDMRALSKCDRRCQRAQGYDCDCSCLGVNHGQESAGWVAVGESTLVADRGDLKRVKITYRNAEQTGGAPSIYNGELSGRPYTVEPRARSTWPRPGEFMCTSCLTRAATVWDHCHVHGYVRAPLCQQCNTRHWPGWHESSGLLLAVTNVDTTYYRYCPMASDPRETACSP